MNSEELKIKLEELEIPSDKIDEVVNMFESKQKEESDQGAGKITNRDEVIELQNELSNEKDWRKRASLSARIISLGLDE